MRPKIVPVILAGGEGRRLRPLTAPTRPKPFLKIFSKASLLQLTLLRAGCFEAPVIVCSGEFAGPAESEAGEVGVSPLTIICEPAQRSTAAAIAAAALLLQNENPLMLVMPSDHIIENAKVFERNVCSAAVLAEDAPVILGRRATGAQTRYAYIQAQEESGVFRLEHFVEKPSAVAAKKLSRMKGMFWNTGIFICRARTLLQLLAQHAPEIFESAGHAMAAAKQQGIYVHPDAARYGRIPALAIDYALMEKLQSGFVVPLETAWHDVGCWERVVALKIRGVGQKFVTGRRGSKSGFSAS